ncbi:PPC domain-containing DNA-binding protein [Aliihoeflea sp. PC F10.4]
MSRFIRHPGPVAPERMKVAPCTAHRVSLDLKAGESVNRAVTGVLGAAGFSSGYARLAGVQLEPLRYVMPAPSPNDAHAAWYSETFAPAGMAIVEDAGLVAGVRDGAPFIHCHGIWQTENGERLGGHLLPHEAEIAKDVTIEAWGLAGANFVARDDAETNFKLFAAETADTLAGRENGVRALACTIRPNVELGKAVADICCAHGFADASVDGVGSFVGVDFADGRFVDSYATEVFLTSGRVANGACNLKVALVDLSGALHEGMLLPGSNRVCVTFELLIREMAG